MAENLDVPGRLAVRTPMQWTSDRHGGFSKASRRITRPMPDGLYSPKIVNVADQRHDPESFWHFIHDLIRLRRQHPRLGWAQVEVLRTTPRSVVAHLCRESDWAMLALHNLSPDGAMVAVSIADVPAGTVLVDLHKRIEHPLGRGGAADIQIDGYGYRWLLVYRPGDPPVT